MPERISTPFIFATCQAGAEAPLKREIAQLWPDFRFAFSRPGFVTFKVGEASPASDLSLDDDFPLHSVLARTHGWSLGAAPGESAEQRAAAAWQLAKGRSCQFVHLWPRAGLLDKPWQEETRANLLQQAAQALQQTAPAQVTIQAAHQPADQTHPAPRGACVLDCVLLEEESWWIGCHRTRSGTSRYPGGLRPERLPAHAVSRAYLKMDEALRWSGLPVKPKERVVELGAAPGGASQALLDRGLFVTGIDPAEIDPQVLAHERFTHLQKRSKDVRRREFRSFDWLTADMNVAPSYTLDAVEEIVAYSGVHLRGLLLTLKLMQWELFDQLPAYLDRIRGWGYKDVRARQLQHNHQELCVAALEKLHMR